MLPTLIVFSFLLLILAYIWGHPLLRYWQHYRIQQRPFPEAWQALLEHRLFFYAYFPRDLRQKLHGAIQVFLAEKQFIGCQGLVITDEMKLVIAAQACFMSLHQPEGDYPQLSMILVYPGIFKIQRPTAVNEYILEEQTVVASGESWGKEGQVILSWQTIQADLKSPQDGHNVIFHEFAHQLDQAHGGANGVPRLKTQADYDRWSRIFTAEYQQLLSQLGQGMSTVIDPYGATNPVEFFAVVTETFWEKAPALARDHRQLYELLKDFYQFDPLILW
ncbi:MAG: M90 family metallopeptidase [Merismopediaceae bacterium]|nr:M90 family metallopeptidase [Merismopediaceae bacterium]